MDEHQSVEVGIIPKVLLQLNNATSMLSQVETQISQRDYETTKLQNTVEDKGTVEQSEKTIEHKSLEEYAETTTEDSSKLSSGNGKITVESSEVELSDEEQSDQVKSQNRSEISTLEDESKGSNQAEINNVISDKDAADFVDKLLMKINANYSSEGKEVKNAKI